jgi:hypothetical protein
MQIAVASTDGENVDEHFGRADRFLVFDVKGGKQTLVGERQVTPLSTGDRDHSFDPARMSGVLDALRDCTRIYCARIGDRPRQELEKTGARAFVGTRPISTISEE